MRYRKEGRSWGPGTGTIAVLAGGQFYPYEDSPRGDHLWAFRQGGAVRQVGAPNPPSKRRDIHAKPVEGTATRNTITLGRVWDEETNAPGPAENMVAENANAPQVLRVPVGTSVTFVNPTDNETAHGAVSFWEPEFDSGVLLPGRSYVHHFDIKREFFYNDPPFPQNTGKIIVY